jgi:hypothetical protein
MLTTEEAQQELGTAFTNLSKEIQGLDSSFWSWGQVTPDAVANRNVPPITGIGLYYRAKSNPDNNKLEFCILYPSGNAGLRQWTALGKRLNKGKDVSRSFLSPDDALKSVLLMAEAYKPKDKASVLEVLKSYYETTGGASLVNKAKRKPVPGIPKLSLEQPFTEPPPPVIFSGKLFVMTGDFDEEKYGFSRESAAELIKSKGGEVKEKAVTEDTDYLIVGSVEGSSRKKIEAAIKVNHKELPIAVISEEHFSEQCAGSNE